MQYGAVRIDVGRTVSYRRGSRRGAPAKAQITLVGTDRRHFRKEASRCVSNWSIHMDKPCCDDVGAAATAGGGRTHPSPG